MIRVTCVAPGVNAAEKHPMINIDHLIVVQEKDPVSGDKYTMLVINGAPPLPVRETPDEIETLVLSARRKRLNALG